MGEWRSDAWPARGDQAGGALVTTRGRDHASKARSGASILKKTSFSTITFLLVLGVVEALLWLAGVAPLAGKEDPFVGFEPGVPLFVRDGDWYVTNEGKTTFFNRQRFAVSKPANGRRVFCLGGSTTFGHPYDARTAYPAWLEAWLVHLAPETCWEVVNCGGISYASYRLALIAEELVRHQPDVIVVHAGHNEFLEDRTYGEIRTWSPPFRLAIGVASRFRAFTLIQAIVRGSLPGATAKPTLPAEVDTILENRGPDAYHRDDVWHDRVEEHFRFSLARIVGLARGVGAKVILVTPASNIGDFGPFKSEHEACSADALARWRAAFTSGREHLESDGEERAVIDLREAERLSPRHAMSLFLLGRALLATGAIEAGLDALRRSRDEDVCPLRAPTRLERVVAEVGREEGVAVVDFPAMLAVISRERSGHGAPGFESFLDHVHPTIGVHGQLGAALYDAIAETDSSLAARPTERSAARAVRVGIESRLRPEDHIDALTTLAMTLAWAGKNDEALRLCDVALAQMPEHTGAARMRGKLLQKLGRGEEALAQLEAAVERAPSDSMLLAHLADEYGRRGRYEKAAACLRRAIENTPERAPRSFRRMLHAQLAQCCRLLGDEPGAVEHGRAAATLRP